MAQNNTPAPASHSTPIGTPLGEISQEPPAFEMFLDKHQMKLIVLGVLIAIAAIGYVIYSGVQDSKEIAAGEKLVAAENTAELKKVVSEFPETAAAISAKLLIAEDQWAEGEQEAAIATLQKFIQTGENHPAKASALSSLGSKLLVLGKDKEAEEAFQQVLDDPFVSYLAPYAAIKLGDILAARGEKEAAIETYTNISADYSESLFKNMANRRLAVIKATAPEVFELPAPAPEETKEKPEATAAPTISVKPENTTSAPAENIPE